MKTKTISHLGVIQILAASLAVFTLALALVGCSSSTQSPSSESASNPSANTSAASESNSSAAAFSDEANTTGIRVNITAPEWNQYTSTPMIAALEPVIEGAVDTTPLYRAVEANQLADIEVPAGLYRITFISGVNDDGSIYTFPGTKEATAETLDATAATLDETATLVIPADVTPGQMEHVIAATTVATADFPNSTEGQSVLEHAIENAQNVPEVPIEQIQSAQELGQNAINTGEGSNVTLNTPPQNLTVA